MGGFAYDPPRGFTPPADGPGETVAWPEARSVLLKGDCLDWLDALPADHFDAVITDPPYHYQTIVERFGAEGAAEAQFGSDGAFRRASAGFMGQAWDGGDIAFRPETWAKVLRVMKPGAHLAAFSAPKCVHRMAVAIETAGFDVRERVINLRDPDPALIAFLDSLSPAQADALFRLTDMFGPLGEAFWCFGTGFPKSHDVALAIDKLLGATPETVPTGAPVKRMILGADQHKAGWEKTNGRTYQPGERIPATESAAAWDGWGTALKPAYEPIVIARKPLVESSVARQVLATGTGALNIDDAAIGDGETRSTLTGGLGRKSSPVYGTFEQETTDQFETTKGRFPANLAHDGSTAASAAFPVDGGAAAARFFYSGKAGADDRLGAGHPTVKPLDLMGWLCRMLCPKGGLVLDPFGGTGTTAEAAFRQGMAAVLIEREAAYHADIDRRMKLVLAGPAERRRAAEAARAERLARNGAGAARTASADDDIFAAIDPPLNAVRAGRSTASSPTRRDGPAHE